MRVHRFTYSLMFLTASLLSLPAAALNKCVAQDGSVTFTDTPCPSNQKGGEITVRVTPPSDPQQAAQINERINQALQDAHKGNASREQQLNNDRSAKAAKAFNSAKPGPCGWRPCKDDQPTAWERQVEWNRLHPRG